MAKKTTRPAKTAQQRNREEQWRRRVSAQGLATVEEVPTASDSIDTYDADETVSETVSASQATVIAPRPRPGTSASSGRATTASQQRRAPAGAASRASRLRPVATGLSMDEEMYYVRSDIRRLIILTAVCLAVLIALSFVIR